MSTAERVAREEDTLRELEECLHSLESTLQQSEQKQSFRAQQEEQVQSRLADAEHDYRLVSEKKSAGGRRVLSASGECGRAGSADTT